MQLQLLMRNRFIKAWPNRFVAVLIGVIGALLMSALLLTGRLMGVSSLRLEEVLGILLTGNPASSWVFPLGLAWHIINGGVFGLVYSACFKKLERGGASTGAALGAAHWLMASLFLGLLLAARSVFPSHIAAEEIFGGSESFGFFLLAHFLFGAVLGAFFQSINIQTMPITPEVAA